jgi:hypothetical protein
MQRGSDDARRIESAVGAVHDIRTFVGELLVGALDWPIESTDLNIDNIGYEWTEADLRARGLSKSIVDGRAYQLVLPRNPWGIFLLEFRNADLLITGRGMTGVLRQLLQGLVERKRAVRDPALAAFRSENLLFICTHQYTRFRFAYFKSPSGGLVSSQLSSFRWGPEDTSAIRTICEYNLAGLRWPAAEPKSFEEWVQVWSSAFDVERVTKRFYEDYADVFNRAEQAIRRGTGLSGDDLRLFTQSFFNRLMFLRFLERKGWLAYPGQKGTRYLEALVSTDLPAGPSLYRARLMPLFFEGLANGASEPSLEFGAVPFLNGGLFEKSPLDDTVPDIPDDVIRSVIGTDGLFYRYNFTVEESTPLDVEVAVDPEMLGRVFEELVTGRHGSGSYYTPRPIVSYMCREALKRYLIDGTTAPAAAMELLVDLGKVEGLTERHAQEVEQQLDNLRAVDPACGSGAYLLGLMHEVIKVRRALRSDSLARDASYLFGLKLHIISNSLYGVDIDPFATEIAKLRLWLSLAIESDEPSPLPNLDFKIETGDSLGAFHDVPDGLFDVSLRYRAHKLVDLKERFLTSHGDDKESLRDEIDAEQREIATDLRHLVGDGVVDWHVQFAEVFSERGGFDVVLANPPYVSALEYQRLHGHQARELVKRRFQTTTGAWDLFVPFFERGVQVLREGGYLAYVSPNKYLSASYAESLRDYLRSQATLLQIVDLSHSFVFQSAAVNPILTFLRKGHESEPPVIGRQPSIPIDPKATDPRTFRVVRIPQSALDLLPERLWGFLLSDRLDLLVRLLDGTAPLSTYADVGATTTAGEADAYGQLVTELDGGSGFRVVNTGTIDPYRSLWGIRDLKNKGSRYRQPVLDGSAVSERRRHLYARPKVLVAKLAVRCEAVVDTTGQYAGLNVNCLTEPRRGSSLEFLCGYLNSSLFMFFYGQLFGALRMGRAFQFQAPQLRVIPVPSTSTSDQQRIAELAREAALAMSAGSFALAAKAQEEIDLEMGALVGLTPDEMSLLDAW